METLMAKWKTTMDSQKKRHNQRNFSADPPDSELSDNEYIKFQAQKIIDIISTSQEPLSCTLYSVTKFQQVCDILQRVMSKEKTKEKPGKKKSEKKPEKIPEKTNDFESKVSELEREKVKIM